MSCKAIQRCAFHVDYSTQMPRWSNEATRKEATWRQDARGGRWFEFLATRSTSRQPASLPSTAWGEREHQTISVFNEYHWMSLNTIHRIPTNTIHNYTLYYESQFMLFNEKFSSRTSEHRRLQSWSAFKVLQLRLSIWDARSSRWVSMGRPRVSSEDSPAKWYRMNDWCS